jgi:hypothetical protein
MTEPVETPEQARARHEEIMRENERTRASVLSRKKAEAAARGKEPFDLAKLESLSATEGLGRMTPDERLRRFEEMYYVEFPDLMTIEELAMEVDELSRW